MPFHSRVVGSATILLAALAAGSAHAVTYTLNFSGASIYNDNGTPEVFDDDTTIPYDGSMAFSTLVPIAAATSVVASSCSLSGPGAAILGCSATHAVDPNGYSTGYNLISFGTTNLDNSGSGTGFLWFAPGSFSTEGVHALYTGTITDGVTFYGNFASAGTLTVSGVPEPGTYVLLLAGIGLVKFAVKRRAG